MTIHRRIHSNDSPINLRVTMQFLYQLIDTSISLYNGFNLSRFMIKMWQNALQNVIFICHHQNQSLIKENHLNHSPRNKPQHQLFNPLFPQTFTFLHTEQYRNVAEYHIRRSFQVHDCQTRQVISVVKLEQNEIMDFLYLLMFFPLKKKKNLICWIWQYFFKCLQRF